MPLQNRINDDLKESMKSRDAARTSALRLIRAEILNLAKEGKGEPTDDVIVQALQRMSRQRTEAIEQFRQGGRADLVEKEEGELAIIRSYLPQEVAEEEIAAAAAEVIAATGAATLKDIGRVMGAVMKKLKETGKAVDGGKVSAAVKKALGA
ncbi:MAG: GatB/YqeY domain-containing protein [Candidatus Sumerlaeota bacterium]|nr:GatB/YqeY domain-containing protein [Candidatus Sumerlaeota bacterium]